jgi:putative ABC transport system permease protein
LGPQQGSLQGPLSAFVNQAADTFDGNGDSFRKALRELSQTAGRLGDSRTDLFDTVRNLQVLVNALSNSNEQIVLLIDRTESLPEVMTSLDALFTREGLDLEAKPWTELALFHNQVVSLFGRELDVIKLIIGTIVILGIANTIGMSIVERRGELATMRALGVSPRAVARLLYTEALLTGLLGGVLGVVLGIVIALAVSAIGIPFPSPPGATRPFLGGVDIVWSIVGFSFLLSVGATLVAAVLPVWKALRRPIAETLRGG